MSLFPLKQLQRLRPHFADDCFSLVSSMKFCTIFAKQTEFGSNSAPPPSSPYCGSPTGGFSADEIRRTLGNCRSKSLLTRDFNTDYARQIGFVVRIMQRRRSKAV
ncbi:unnamed protein product [Camellia sinensis]